MRSLENTPSAPLYATTRVSKFGFAARFVMLSTASIVLLTVVAIVMFLVACVTGFQTQRWLREVAARQLSLAILFIWGVRVELHQAEPWPSTQVIYISNHTSTLDLFILMSLGLSNTRYFLFGKVRRWCVPLGVIGYLIGVFWTCPQDQPTNRVRCFQSAERVLRRTKESVYLSPEGDRVTTGLIGPFNKGAFHLATNLRVPFVPLYIQIPRSVDPGRGLNARPGTVHVFVKPSIPTTDWTLEMLERNREAVRGMFVAWHEVLHPS
jgi:1-acyl-sn-glycerol-3-phosphate acyltransferase